MTAPILNRGALKAEFKKANASQLQALYSFQKTVVTAYTEVYNELARSKYYDEQLQFKLEESNAAKKSVEYSIELFKNGRSNYLEVLMAQHNSLASQIELITIQKEKVQNSIRIYKALGGGWN